MIEERVIAAVAARLGQEGADEAAVARLRQEWPRIHFTTCADDDIGAIAPFRREAGYNLYLVQAQDHHCIVFTHEPDAATGLVIASVEDEDAA